MNDDQPSPAWFLLLERITSGVLLAVIGALGWIMGAAYGFDWLRLPQVETEVLIILGLLAAALILLSGVALLQTRPRARQGPP